MAEPSRLERICRDKGLKMTAQRRVIARVLSDSTDHPDAAELHRRVARIDRRISLATVYRTVRLFESARILTRHDFGAGRGHYEDSYRGHHDHLIDVRSGRVIEFRDEALERLKARIARRLGYDLIGHKLELYGAPAKRVRDPGQG